MQSIDQVLPLAQSLQAHDKSPASQPVELDLSQLDQVGGGSPNGTWSPESPNGTW